MSFQTETKGGILFLTLNTYGASVNIFNLNSAIQLENIMKTISPSKARAVVIRSSKPGSFINGVGLLMANAVKSRSVAEQSSRKIRMAYDSIKNAKVPTIALINGNCFGCGVELALNCNYRIAVDSVDTRFYMTEINDYLFIPCFGATQNLPRLLGFKRAVDFLLWGKRWSANEALKNGLVHKTISRKELDGGMQAILQNLVVRKSIAVKHRWPNERINRADISHVINKNRERISALPPQYHKVYSDCLNLMSGSLKSRVLSKLNYRNEFNQSVRSVMTPASKAALSFFFTRQTVKVLCTPKTRLPHHWEIKLQAKKNKNLSAIKWRSENVKTVLKVTSSCKNKGPILYSPFYGRESRFVEIAVNSRNLLKGQYLYTALSRLGFDLVISHSKSSFASNELLVAYLMPQLLFCWRGGNPSSIHYTLRSFGFCVLPNALIKCAGEKQLAALLGRSIPSSMPKSFMLNCLMRISQTDFSSGERMQYLLDALDVSLYNASHELLEKRTVLHPALVDLIAREMLDFPLEKKSLCAYLTNERVGAAMNGASRILPRESLEACTQRLACRQDFYLSQKNFLMKEV